MADCRLPILILAMLLAMPISPALGQGKDTQSKPVSSPYMVLIRDPVVQRELQLDPSQQNQILALTDRADGLLWMIRAMSVEKGSPALAKLIIGTQVEMKKILSTRQNIRLREIVLRVQGSNAFLRDDVVGYLGLNEAQSTEITASIEETEKEIATLEQRLKDGETREKLEPLANKIKKRGRQDLVAILSDAQREKLTTMLGQEFDASRLGNVKLKAPELDVGGGWINSSSLKLADLRGKVVALHFMAYG